MYRCYFVTLLNVYALTVFLLFYLNKVFTDSLGVINLIALVPVNRSSSDVSVSTQQDFSTWRCEQGQPTSQLPMNGKSSSSRN